MVNDIEEVGSARPRLPLRPLTIVMVVSLLVMAVGSYFVGRNVIDDQEDRLLEQRAGEVGALLTNVIENFNLTLAAFGTIASVTDSNPEAFEARGQAAAAAGQLTSIALVDIEDGTVIAAAGQVLTTGATIDEVRFAAIERAGPELVSTEVFRVREVPHLGLALGPPIAPPGTAVYSEAIIDPEAIAASAASGEPFSDLDIALYVGPEPEESQLLLTTADDIGAGAVERTVEVGAEEWAMLVVASKSLVGGLAANLPWILLGATLVVALLVGGLMEALGRRRDFAMAVAEERTAALRQSMRELEEARDQLVQKERLAAIGELASAVGHELRNPLGVLSNALYLVRRGLDNRDSIDPERVKRLVTTAERELAAATLIVSDLLEFAQRREPALAAVALPDLVEEALSVAPAPDGVTVTTRYADDLPPVDADRDQLRQVFLNLVVNAYDALANEEGAVSITAEPSEHDRVRLTVADTGVGMDDEVRSQIFEPFFTVKAKGIGLGLAVTKRIVTGHGGAIDVESTPGEGTVFTVTLRAAKVASATQGTRV